VFLLQSEGVPMNTIVIEHVKVEELPQAWRVKFAQTANIRVTVRIEEEAQAAAPAEEFVTDDPLADVAGYVRKLRASRFNNDGSRRDA
jgi:hypothetical protein